MRPLALLLLGLRLAGASFKICAFNTHGFGEAKSVGISWQILVRCDIAALQEVRDATGTAVQALLWELNRYWASQDPWVPAPQVGGEGRGSGNQDSWVPPPPQERLGDSAPGWGSTGSGPEGGYPSLTAPHPPPAIKDFVLLSHHASPRNAPHEIHQLHWVCQELSQRWGTQNVMVLGDLNAGGSYVPPSTWGSIQLRWDPRFHWLIGDGVDTTVRARTHCAYDRYQQMGSLLGREEAETPPSRDYQLSPGGKEQGWREAVSDHYPVEVNLRLASRTPQEL
uniref:Endonuclease/exonuclease/phosphatase domain-containing protein n=1 Tax=Gopherus agassizii TaxID=38772 RepID=A0A452GXH4_9SAUR